MVGIIALAAVIAASSSVPGAVAGLQLAPRRPLFLAVGVGVLAVTVVDLLWTTLWGDGGAGPLSALLMSGLWRGLRNLGELWSRVLSLVGPVILVLNLVLWVGLVWTGWTLVFAGGGGALVNARVPEPVTWTGRISFVAQAMFTMGNGDFYPTSGVWHLAAALTTASGLLSVTLGVTYLLSVLGAVVEKRSFAKSITGIGRRSEAFVVIGWNGEDFRQFDLVLDTLTGELSHLAAQHRTHPILHYYRTQRQKNSPAVAIAVFDEALTLLRFGIPEEHHPNNALLESARSNVESYLRALGETFEPADQPPPPPGLDRLRDAGIPTVSDEEFANALENLDERRRQLAGLVEAKGWSWPPEEEN